MSVKWKVAKGLNALRHLTLPITSEKAYGTYLSLHSAVSHSKPRRAGNR